MRAQVKWWDDGKGFGFVTVNGEDYFCHYSALDDSPAFKSLIAGSWINVELIDGPKGPQVAKATNWAHGDTLEDT